MRGLDTNVIIRYLVQAHLEQSAIATTFIEQKCTETQPGFICHIVLCEVIWVLKTCYKVPKASVARPVNVVNVAQMERSGIWGTLAPASATLQPGYNAPLPLSNCRLG